MWKKAKTTKVKKNDSIYSFLSTAKVKMWNTVLEPNIEYEISEKMAEFLKEGIFYKKWVFKIQKK